MLKSHLVAQIVGVEALGLAPEFLRVAGEAEEFSGHIKKQKIRFYDSGKRDGEPREKLLVMDWMHQKSPHSIHLYFSRCAGATSIIRLSYAMGGRNMMVSVGEGVPDELYHYSHHAKWIEDDHQLTFSESGARIDVGIGLENARIFRKETNALLRSVEKRVADYADINP